MVETGSLLLGKPRLRQQRSQQACPTSGYFPAASWFGCGPAGWAESGERVAMNWSHSMSRRNGAWQWGQVSVYNGAGFVQELGRTMEESTALIKQLHEHHWLDPWTRALFMEFSLYNTNTDLLVVFSFLLEFPVSGRPVSSFNLKTCSLQTLQAGLDLPLFLTLILMILIVYFSMQEGLSTFKQGWGYFLRLWNLVGVVTLLLAVGVSALHLSRSALASHLWASLLRQKESFINFFPLGQQSQVLVQLSATLLFLLVLKAAHQLRFLREWAVFGRTLRRSAWEIVSIAVALLLLLLAYSHMGYILHKFKRKRTDLSAVYILVMSLYDSVEDPEQNTPRLFHAIVQGYGTVPSACLALLGSGHGLCSWGADRGTSPCFPSCYVFHVSFAALRLVLLWMVTSVFLRNYRRVRAELYRPAVDLQDYEMVELFLRRLKMWMGLSRTKEFRHKVRFEGMELPPSRSSSTSDCKSLCLPPLDAPEAPSTPDSVDCGSESSWHPMSSSPCSLVETAGLGLGLTLSLGVVAGGQPWRERAETEATLRRVLPAFDALLLQLDRVNQATEELYRTECKLEKVQRRSRKISHGGRRNGGQDSAGQRRNNGSHRRSHSIGTCPRKVEKNGDLESSRPKSEKSSHKSDKRTRKRDTTALETSPQEDMVPKDTSLRRMDLHSQVTSDKVETHVTKTETTRSKVDSSPIKVEESAVKIEASTSVLGKSDTLVEAGSHKPTKGSHKAASSHKVNPIIPRDAETVGCASKRVPSQTQAPIPIAFPATPLSTASSSTITTPVPIPRALQWNPPSYTDDLPSSLFQHPAHTTIMPIRKRKHKAPPLKNKIHPNTDRPISGHGKP